MLLVRQGIRRRGVSRPRNPYTAPSLKCAWGKGLAGLPLPAHLTDRQYREAYAAGVAARTKDARK